jgi:histone-lysine N-methyltransferase SETMAR
MAGLAETWSNIEVRSVIRFLHLKGTSPAEIHPPYSPDLAPSDFHLFGQLKKHLGGRRFATDGEVQQAVMSWLQALGTDFFYAGIDALVYRWNKCLDKYGDNVEK